jgi:hypothetical protein
MCGVCGGWCNALILLAISHVYTAVTQPCIADVNGAAGVRIITPALSVHPNFRFKTRSLQLSLLYGLLYHKYVGLARTVYIRRI